MQPTQITFTALVRACLSSDRLEAYRRQASETDLDLLARYQWNTVLSEALYPPLQGLEIALRNAIHEAATVAFGTPYWFDQGHVLPGDSDPITQAKVALTRRQKPLDPGRIVAELNFGFWTTLLDRRYEQRLWPRLLRATFPHLPRRMRTRHAASGRFNTLRTLRNRVSHHEPIWYWPHLAQRHDEILEAIGWISPAYAHQIALIDRFPTILAAGPHPQAQAVRGFLATLPPS
jgi:hypothetical protein